jgi:hypothetical protein
MVTKSFLDHINTRKHLTFPKMLVDWVMPRGNYESTGSAEVNFF